MKHFGIRQVAERSHRTPAPNEQVHAFPAALYSSGEIVRLQLLAQAELVDDALITFGIVFLQVVEQTAAFADQH